MDERGAGPAVGARGPRHTGAVPRPGRVCVAEPQEHNSPPHLHNSPPHLHICTFPCSRSQAGPGAERRGRGAEAAPRWGLPVTSTQRPPTHEPRASLFLTDIKICSDKLSATAEIRSDIDSSNCLDWPRHKANLLVRCSCWGRAGAAGPERPRLHRAGKRCWVPFPGQCARNQAGQLCRGPCRWGEALPSSGSWGDTRGLNTDCPRLVSSRQKAQVPVEGCSSLEQGWSLQSPTALTAAQHLAEGLLLAWPAAAGGVRDNSLPSAPPPACCH